AWALAVVGRSVPEGDVGEPVGVGEHVERDDPAVDGLEGHEGKHPTTAPGHDTWPAVDEHGHRTGRDPREGSGALGERPRTGDDLAPAHPVVGTQDDVLVEQGEQRPQVAVLDGTEPRLDHLPAAPSVPGRGPGTADLPTRAGGELSCRGRGLVEDARDLVE